MKKLIVLLIVLCLGCSDPVRKPVQRAKIIDLDMNYIYFRQHDYGDIMPTDNSYLYGYCQER